MRECIASRQSRECAQSQIPSRWRNGVWPPLLVQHIDIIRMPLTFKSTARTHSCGRRLRRGSPVSTASTVAVTGIRHGDTWRCSVLTGVTQLGEEFHEITTS
ncbi:hypothetical protein AVEN_8572-1 [Araneus ventricosus]|uniref:Uncharacterized protein n=1 Tax=Araneus ventricosus TaxID=182803 RepID=A0A4Y2UWL5_ARAVE|nr:hypothetical protein AVEN_8572-1 [Araneus ventricosus]